MNALKSTMVSTTSRDDLIGRQISMMITFFGLSLVLAFTLFPYDFHFKEMYSNTSGQIPLILGWGTSGVPDVFKNVLLFMPLGFGLTCLMQKRRYIRLVVLVVVILVSLGLSYTVEVLQFFLPSRYPSLVDILSNSAGGILGLLCFLLWESKVIDHTSAFIKRNLQLGFLGYAIFAFLISVSLQHFSSLSNWDKTFSLLLGNERTGDRPWRGYIHEVYIADRALSETEVSRTFSEGGAFASIGDSLLASYQLTGIGGYHDKIGNLPDLVWRGKSQDDQKGEGVFLSDNSWLETTVPAEYLTQRIIEISQFTLGITVATSDTKQTGPARIISLSEDTSHRNFTLGQQGTDLVFRLRTPLTGKNGTNPQLMVPEVFSSTNPHNLIITYDGSSLLLYVDGKRSSYALKLDPGIIIFSSLFRLSTYYMIGYKAMHYMYYALVFVPLGILITLTVKIMRSRFVIKILIIFGSLLLTPFMLEKILVGVSGRDLKLENLLISMLFIAIPMFFFKYVTPHLLEKS